MDSGTKAAAAEKWYGYGTWDAPYWFVGKEPGGADDPEQCASWLRLGGGELIDCRQHDSDCVKPGSTMPHPTAHGIGTSFWPDLGSRLAAASR